MHFTPWPYQQLIIERQLDQARGNDWAGMGLGKTVSTLTTIDGLQLAGACGRVLVLAPKRVARSTWPKEVRKWDHLSGMEVSPIIGTQKQRLAALRRDVGVYTLNYENLPWLIEEAGLRRWPFDMVVADESTRLKGFRLRKGTKRATALARVARRTQRWINLTGTPSPNGLLDLWGQQWFVDFGHRLGLTYTAYRDRWFMPERFDGDARHVSWAPMPTAQAQIEDRLRDCTRTIRAKDWFDLEEPIVKIVPVELSGKARRLYDEMEKEMYTEIERDPVEALNAASKTNKCRQIANGAAYIDDAHNWREIHDRKLEALEDIIEEAAGMPVLVAYQFVHDRERILKAFPRARLLDDDPQTEDDWNAGKIPLLVTHAKSAGHGLNLQDGGNILVFFGLDWNLEEHDQIIERIGPTRQLQSGNDRPVFLYYILAEKTVDRLVLRRIETKRSVQDILLEAMIERRAA